MVDNTGKDFILPYKNLTYIINSIKNNNSNVSDNFKLKNEKEPTTINLGIGIKL